MVAKEVFAVMGMVIHLMMVFVVMLLQLARCIVVTGSALKYGPHQTCQINQDKRECVVVWMAQPKKRHIFHIKKADLLIDKKEPCACRQSIMSLVLMVLKM